MYLYVLFFILVVGCLMGYSIGLNEGKKENKYRYIFRIKEDGTLWQFTKPGGPIELTVEEMDMVSNAIGRTEDYPGAVITGHFVTRLE